MGLWFGIVRVVVFIIIFALVDYAWWWNAVHVGGRSLRFQEVVVVSLICRSLVSGVSVAVQVAALLL